MGLLQCQPSRDSEFAWSVVDLFVFCDHAVFGLTKWYSAEIAYQNY